MSDVVEMSARTGTAPSAKFIGRLAYGEGIVASCVASRGCAVKPEWHAVVSDVFIRYSDLIRELLCDRERPAEMGRRARAWPTYMIIAPFSNDVVSY
jgi:hypothetical protein